MTLPRRHRLSCLSSLLLPWVVAWAALAAPVAQAQGGGRALRIVVSFPPGGPVDFVARALAETLGKELQTSVLIDNRAGAAEVPRAARDGSTPWLSSVGAVAAALLQRDSQKWARLIREKHILAE